MRGFGFSVHGEMGWELGWVWVWEVEDHYPVDPTCELYQRAFRWCRGRNRVGRFLIFSAWTSMIGALMPFRGDRDFRRI